MATTRITDIVPVKTFAKIVEGKIIENSKFRQSGIVAPDARIQAKVDTAGFETTLPFWKAPLAAEAQSFSDDPADKAAARAVTQGSMIARLLQRQQSFSAMDIADYASDSDAISYAASQFARLWAADEELAILAILKGVMADNVANDNGDMRVNKAITTGTIAFANKMSGSTLLDGRRQLGDLGGQLKILATHSDVVNNLRAAEPNSFVPASKTDIGLEQYQGWTIVETDNLTVDTTVNNYPVYTSYLFEPGVFGYGVGDFGEASLVQVRDEFAGGGSGQETIMSRRKYLLQPLGFSNKAAPTNGVSQENAELEVAATWDRVAPNRRIVPLVQIKTNG